MSGVADVRAPRPRLLSLDILRGATVAAMILVNCPGNDSLYPWLEHAPWDGCRFADFVFPSFLVIMGISIAISLGRRLEAGEPRPLVRAQAVKRSGIILALGLISSLVMIGSLGFFRIPGVLQRIAACYLVCSLLYIDAGAAAQAAACAGLLVGYWALMRFVPAPGRAAGDLSPAGNLASYVDHRLLGNRLLAETHDPEGLLSTLPAIATTLLGVLAGDWLRGGRRPRRRARDFLAAGLAVCAAGLLWSRWYPLNKNLWTGSFALTTGGAAIAAFGLCYWVVEDAGWTAWGRPFEVFGRNALASYFLSELLYGLQEFVKLPLADGRPGNLKLWLDQRLFGWLPPPGAALAYGVAYLLLCLALMSLFHRRKLFIRV